MRKVALLILISFFTVVSLGLTYNFLGDISGNIVEIAKTKIPPYKNSYGVYIGKERHVANSVQIDRKTLLTNAHVCEVFEKYGIEQITFKNYLDKFYTSQGFVVSHNYDLCLITIKGKLPPGEKIEVQPLQPAYSEQLIYTGFHPSFGSELTSIIGIVTTHYPLRGDFGTDHRVVPGTSGGPYYNLKGELVGVMSALYPRAGYTKIISGKNIYKFLNKELK